RLELIPQEYHPFTTASQFAFASVSPLTGAVLMGAERVYTTDWEYDALEDNLKDLARRVGELCYLTEHHRYRSGLTYSGSLLLRSSLESVGWKVEEAIPFLGNNLGAWLAWRRGDVVLVVLINLDMGVGYVSFCQMR
ncbi:hypothetical protein, partial [Thermus thalpophilus]